MKHLRRVEFFNDWQGSIVIRTEWTEGEPIGYAPAFCEQERLPFDQASRRIGELLKELDFTIS